jgi:hypothetical protein
MEDLEPGRSLGLQQNVSLPGNAYYVDRLYWIAVAVKNFVVPRKSIR